jgi:hypothetical protein
MSNALQIIANNTGASPEDIEALLRTMIISGKNQHGALATDAEMVVATSICSKYSLNPMMKEIAIFQTGGKLQFTIPIDGWIKLLNRNENFDGVEFEYFYNQDGSIMAIESIIHMKNRQYPVKTREFMDECVAMGGPTWKKCPARMLRNKSLGQGVRIACGVTEVIDDDEAYRIKNSVGGGERDITPQAPEINLEEFDSQMSECSTHEQLKTLCGGIKDEMQRDGTWSKYKGDIVAMNAAHRERIDSMSTEITGELVDGEQAE